MKITELGPSIAPVSPATLFAPVPVRAPVELSFEQLLGTRRWQDDLYRGRIAMHISGQGWHWAHLRDDIVTVGIRVWANQHHWLQTQDQFLAGRGEGLETYDAINAGWITIGEPLDDRHRALIHTVRFGRVGVVLRDGLLLTDGGNMDEPLRVCWRLVGLSQAAIAAGEIDA